MLRKQQMEQKFGKTVVPVNCRNMNREEAFSIMEQLLADFPITRINFLVPKWVEFLTMDNWLKQDLVAQCREVLSKIRTMKDVSQESVAWEAPYLKEIYIRDKQMENGIVNLVLDFEDSYYYEILSEMVGTTIEGEFDLIATLRELSSKKNEYESIAMACSQVKGKGYGIVPPEEKEIQIADPELIRHGNKYGVKIKASCPSLHLIQANIETEGGESVDQEEKWIRDIQRRGSRAAAEWLERERVCRVVGRGLERFWRARGDRDPDFWAAAAALTPEAMERFNRENPDSPLVYYQSWGARLDRPGWDPMDRLQLWLTRADGPTDGLVSPESAVWGRWRGTLEGVSHQDGVGGRRRKRPGFDAGEFYIRLVRELAEMGF